MKKLILLSLLGLFFLAGYKNTIQTPDHLVQEQKSLETILPPDTGSYPQPIIQITTGTGTMLVEFNSKINNEVSRTSTKEEQENGRKESVVSGYIYTYIYKDLGIKVTTPPLYEPYFFEKTETLIFHKQQNIIYNSLLGNKIWGDYIGVFTKDSKISFEEEIQKNHLPTGCKLFTGILGKQTTIFDSTIGFEAIYFEDINEKTRCTIDKQFPEREMPIIFVMNPKNPNVYYKLGIQDGCAPGPCTIFGNIEFF